MLTAIGYIALAISVIGNIWLWYLKNKYGKEATISKLKVEINELEKKDNALKQKQTEAFALSKSDSINGIFVERELLAKQIASLRDKLRKEGIDY